MFNGCSEMLQPSLSPLPTTTNDILVTKPYVRIIEQPAQKALRFRYECEGRSAGSIPGASSTSENKTFPSIQVVGYQGRAVVVVSCVTKDAPHRPHPHNLVGREGCKRGVCTLEIPQDTMMIQFCNLGIQCVKKKDIESALKQREEIRVDPFKTGFNHRTQPTSIDLNSVRLCFQVFTEGTKKGQFSIALPPVISQPIYDKKAMSDLIIVKLSDCTAYVDGDRKDIILLCEKIAKEDIQVRFYEEKDGMLIWEGYGDFQASQVHKQVAICFKPPRYRDLTIQYPVKVFIQLRRPSDGATSEAVPFEFLPIIDRKRKRAKLESLMNIKLDDPSFNIKSERDTPFPWAGGVVLDTTEQYRLPSISPNNQDMGAVCSNWNITPYPNVQQNVQPIQETVDSNDYKKLLNIESGELCTFDAPIDVLMLSDTLNTNLSLGDNNNMTDSLTTLANNTINSIYPDTNTFQ